MSIENTLAALADMDDIAPQWERDEMAERIYANCAALAMPGVMAKDRDSGLAYLEALASYARLAAAAFFDERDHAEDGPETQG